MKPFLIAAALLLLVTPPFASAQTSTGHLEASIGGGLHTILNDMTPSKPGSTGYLDFAIGYNLSETSYLGVRYGAANYKVTSLVSEEEAWMGDLFAVYRYSWRPGTPTRVFVEIGAGIADAIPLYDSGIKAAATLALGIKRHFGGSNFVQVETRGIGFQQRNRIGSDTDVTVSASEFTLAIGRVF
jgi:hypothetical protein